VPELPEVETTVRILKSKLVGKTIGKIEILSEKQFPGNPSEVAGAKIINIERHGKMIVIRLDNQKSLITHLKLTGQLIYAEGSNEGDKVTFPRPIPFAGGNSLPGRSTRVIIFFKDGSRLFFNDMRKFGWTKVIQNSKFKIQNLDKLGIEPFSKEFTPDLLEKIFARTSRPVKIVLMDQEKIAGIGNIYANEALFKAGILPNKPAKDLTLSEIEKLHRAIIEILSEAIKEGGTSAADDAYVKPDGTPGQHQQHLLVYQKKGLPCPHCRGTIQRIELGGRGTFFCPKCQS